VTLFKYVVLINLVSSRNQNTKPKRYVLDSGLRLTPLPEGNK